MEVTIATIVVGTTREGEIVVDTITRTAGAATRITLQEGKIWTQTLPSAKLDIQREKKEFNIGQNKLKTRQNIKMKIYDVLNVVRYGGGGSGDRYNNFGDGDRHQRQGSAPPNSGGRWDNLEEDRSFSARRGGGQQDGGDWGNNNRWDNRTDNNAGGKYPQETTKENWTIPLPPNPRLEE